MPNMSYVQFENTYNDLYDTFSRMHELQFPKKELSESEYDYFVKLVKLCNDISSDFLEEVKKAR